MSSRLSRPRRIGWRAHCASLGALSLVFSSGCGDEVARPVSLLRVVVEPAAMEGERVLLRGFLAADLRLYPAREMAERFDRASSLRVSDPEEEGVFAARCSGRSAELSGRIVRRRGASRASDDPQDYRLDEIDRVLTLSEDGQHTLCWGAQEPE